MDAPVEHRNRRDPAFVFGRNPADDLVIETLATAPLLSLSLDELAHVLCKPGQTLHRNHDLDLRIGLIRVYINAAISRLQAKVKRSRLMEARKAQQLFARALEALGNVHCPARDELLSAAIGYPVDNSGSPISDTKGLHESSPFEEQCQDLRVQMVRPLLDLERLIERENAKPSKRGERQKRLRSLIESLKDWWISETGKSIAPYVEAKRLDHRSALVLGRKGEFVSLAVALFCQCDRFSESEVIAAITNVHEKFLRRDKLQKNQ
jgi:hypothetical protein